MARGQPKGLKTLVNSQKMWCSEGCPDLSRSPLGTHVNFAGSALSTFELCKTTVCVEWRMGTLRGCKRSRLSLYHFQDLRCQTQQHTLLHECFIMRRNAQKRQGKIKLLIAMQEFFQNGASLGHAQPATQAVCRVANGLKHVRFQGLASTWFCYDRQNLVRRACKRERK